MSRPVLVSAALVLACALSAASALADDMTCDSCESCTTKLAAPGARVALGKDVAHTGEGACVVVRGEGAQLDGLEHTIRPSEAGTAVRVEGAGVLVKNVHVAGGATGIEVASAARTTLFHAWVAASRVGVRVVSADEVRVTRSVIQASGVGISFGASDDGACAGAATLQSPGAVVIDTRVQGAKVGISACEAYPVLARNEIVDNGVGLLLAAPASSGGDAKAKGPFDPCACAPTLEGVKPSTTLLYSSGCGGCQVHEAWLPDLRKRGVDVVVRETGPGKAEGMAKFDAFMDRCAPEVTDAIGIPGCVPNYTCLANGVAFKTRQGDQSLAFETQINSADDVAAYAKACKESASLRFRAGKDCVAHALASNVICKNRELDVRALPGGPKLDGVDDTCDKAEGFADSGTKGCAKPCPDAVPPRTEPASRATREATGAAVPTAAGVPAVAGSAAPTPSSAPAPSSVQPAHEPSDASSQGKSAWKGWVVGVAGVALAAAALRLLLRSGKPS